MALYWRSPYKEMKFSSSQSEVKASPRSLRSVKSANSRFSEPVSPQDWFDPSQATIRNAPGSGSSKRGIIKGILKDTQQSVGGEGNAYQHLESESSIEELSIGKKTKKRVTFGVQNTDSTDRNYDFQAFRSTSAHQFRLQHREPLDEFARQNLRKLLGYAPTIANLPSLSGKAMLPYAGTSTPPTTPPHGVRSQLSTPPSQHPLGKSPRPTPGNSIVDTSKSFLELSVDGIHPATPETVTDAYDDSKDKPFHYSHQDPTKKVKRHWTNSFMRSVEKKKLSRHLAGRYPLSAGVIHRNFPFRRMSADKIGGSEELSKDIVKLRITGGGNVHEMTDDHDHLREHVSQGSARSEGQGIRGFKIPSTMTQFPTASPTSVGQRTLSSANQIHIKYGTPRFEPHLDKTSQILSWLQDVKQKEGFQPRNARLYALELQQQH